MTSSDEINLNAMKFVAIIPARYASTRFPAKPLAMLGGKPIIQHVYERVRQSIPETFVAVDDMRVRACVEAFGGKAILTSPKHKSGTDRIEEAYRNIGKDYDVIVNVQGDEPFIRTEQIEALKRCFYYEETEIATLVKPFDRQADTNALFNPNTPKVVIDKNQNALYFSRAVIPFMRGVEQKEWLKQHAYYKHIGIYGYRTRTLSEITKLPQSPLEKAESLEQLRWLENGYKIKTGITAFDTVGIDTPEDLLRAEEFLKSYK